MDKRATALDYPNFVKLVKNYPSLSSVPKKIKNGAEKTSLTHTNFRTKIVVVPENKGTIEGNPVEV